MVEGTLGTRVRAWIADDPDPDARTELQRLLDASDHTALEARFAHGLTFGTAGLRGPLRAGPSGMNLATVRRASAGLARYVLDTADDGGGGVVVVGHDARHGSARFAAEAAAVFSGAGLEVLRLPPLAPTPLLAFAVRALGCAAGVMVTASHNPPGDNGYKVYLGDGAQIAPPVDEAIAARIDAIGPLADVPLGDGGEAVGDAVADAYLAAVVGALPDTPEREIRVAYTPLHGVGAPLALAAFARAGFPAPAVVAAQAEPDPDFATVTRPNPEEPGTLDLGLACAAEHGADLLIANDPDADRLAAAIPQDGSWRVLRGDEIGVLLAGFILEHLEHPAQTLLATTVASSTLLGRMADDAGAAYAETLTGFKWLMRADARATGHRLAFAYEEALGYAVSDVVRDKDGISAALVLAQLVARCRAQGRTLADRLDDLAERFGLHRTDQLTLELAGADGVARRRAVMARLRANPPQALLGRPLTSCDDLERGARGLPRADVLILEAEGARVVVRPSGTEPKLKAYLQVVVPGADHAGAEAAMAALRDEVQELIGA